MKIRKCFELNTNKNNTHWKLGDEVKRMLRWKLILLNENVHLRMYDGRPFDLEQFA